MERTMRPRERRTSMLRRTLFVTVGLVVLGAGLIAGSALATPVSGASAETARGPLVDRPLDVTMDFENGSEVELKTKGRIEVAYQRITIQPGGTLGWHSHPGPTVVTVFQGTLSFYHAEDCTTEIEYLTGQSFSNLPDEIHLARNEGAQPVVVFASYYVPLQSPPVALRIDQPSPGPACPL
jgi:quercetin dioxygenase-like cupin family protein